MDRASSSLLFPETPHLHWSHSTYSHYRPCEDSEVGPPKGNICHESGSRCVTQTDSRDASDHSVNQVDCDMRLDAREEFHRVIISPARDRQGVLVAASTGGQQSSRVASLCGANGLVHLPLREDGGKDKVNKGDIVQAVLIGEIRG